MLIDYLAARTVPSNELMRVGANWCFSSQQALDDGQPFRFKALAADGFPGPTVPISSIVLITFLAVQVGVDPRTFGTFILLGGLVGSSPVAFSVPPESEKCGGESWWRLGRGERLAEVVQGHGARSVESLHLRQIRPEVGHPVSGAE
jgi:hypothetical protein